MEIIEFMLDNFLGMSYSNQIKVIEFLMENSKEGISRRVLREFGETFEFYLDKLKSLLEFKDLYSKCNSDKRRLIRKTLLEYFGDLDLEYHHLHTDENLKDRRYYAGNYWGEGKKYFEARQVPEEMVRQFMSAYLELSIPQKREFLKDMTFYYQNVNRFVDLPYPDNMIASYNDIIQSILGDDLMKYYNQLYKAEQLELILKLVNEFGCIKSGGRYYRYQLSGIKEKHGLIRQLKKQVIDRCKEFFDE